MIEVYLVILSTANWKAAYRNPRLCEQIVRVVFAWKKWSWISYIWWIIVWD